MTIDDKYKFHFKIVYGLDPKQHLHRRKVSLYASPHAEDVGHYSVLECCTGNIKLNSKDDLFII